MLMFIFRRQCNLVLLGSFVQVFAFYAVCISIADDKLGSNLVVAFPRSLVSPLILFPRLIDSRLGEFQSIIESVCFLAICELCLLI
jgi:hypothetical protein